MPFGFKKPAHTCEILTEGWDVTGTPWGSWSTQHHATLRLPLESDAHRMATLRFYVIGFDPWGLQRTSIFVGAQYETDWYPDHQKVSTFDVTLPIAQALEVIDIHFLFAEPVSMKWLGQATNNLDHRLLGMGLLGIDWINPNSAEFGH